MNSKAQFYINHLNLHPHPEGGYFRELYRSSEKIKEENLPSRFKGDRCFSTSIYFLLEGNQVSKFHRIKSDEIWHFYDGSSVRIYILDQKGKLNTVTLGKELSTGELFQTVIGHGNWFAAEVIDKTSYCLVGCDVSPGFDYNDFELADRNKLLTKFPQHRELIINFT